MKLWIILCAIALVSTVALAEQHSTFTTLLRQHVQNGRVSYRELCKTPTLSSYIQQLSQTDPENLSKEEALAFWINAYNAFTLKVICDNYPVKSINELHTGGKIIGTLIKGTIWDKKFISINGQELSLNHIEHEILRKKFREPRIHFALVCASISCPPLREEAYEANKLNQQLEDQARFFFSDRERNFYDVPNKTAYISRILDWYSQDFGKTKEEILLFVARFAPPEPTKAIKADPANWKVQYTDYDWGLNE